MKQCVASKSEHELFIASRFWERHLGEVPARGAGGRWVDTFLVKKGVHYFRYEL